VKEIESLIERANRYLRSAELLLKEGDYESSVSEKRQLGDYEYTFVITKEEAKEILTAGEKFVERIVRYLDENKIL
jgi:uncharacterized protein (UPF0332 family)